jgi:metal-responsive CopG/Arc/MetJ family transcriptional regulator
MYADAETRNRLDYFVKHNTCGYRSRSRVIEKAVSEFLERHWDCVA